MFRLHSQSLGEPGLKFKCLVWLKSRAGLETQNGFFQQKREGLAAHTPLGLGAGARSEEELWNCFQASVPQPPVPPPAPGLTFFLLFSKPLLEEAGSGLSYYGLSPAPRYGCDRWSLAMGI